TVCTDKRTLWGIPGVALTEFAGVKDAAQAALALVKDKSTRTPVTVARCKAAFDALKAFMRDFKRRYFLCPPLTDEDLVSLGLKPHAKHHTPVKPPETAPEFSIVQMGPGAIGIVYWDGEKGKKGSKPEGVEGARVYYCVSDVPITDQRKLPFSEWATKCPHIIRFPEADRGKWVYIALKWEIRKEHGESPWSRVRSEMIS
ncbi:MAG: hypothetical protein LBL31_01985, partial [Spirochaetaceae bacterium]|nr:hypothetical protein [Spirochaetaceae bacterium]